MIRPLSFAFFTERMRRGFGVDLAIHYLASLLVERGHSVTVWTVFPGENPSDERSLYSLRTFPVGTTVFLPWYDRTVLRRLRQIPETHSADIFVVTHPMGAALKSLSPSIFIEFGVAPRIGLGLRERLNEIYARSLHYLLFIRRANSILVPSAFLRESLPGFLRAKARDFRLGVDHYPGPSPIEVASFRSSLPAGKPLTLYVGRLTHSRQPYKGVRLLLEMFHEVRNLTHLVLAGVGTEDDRRIAEKLGATVFLSPAPGWMPILYAACDIFVTATLWEGVDLPLLEAMHFKKAVVAFDIPVHREWVQSGVNGILAKNRAEFIAGWRRLITDHSFRQRLSDNAASRVASFKWETATDILETVALDLVRA